MNKPIKNISAKPVARKFKIVNEQPKTSNQDEYNVEDLNQIYAVVLNGSDAVIIRFDENSPLEHQFSFVKEKGFRLFYHNKFVERTGIDGKKKEITWAQAWLSDPKRRTYQSMSFVPDPNTDLTAENQFNLWRGFAVKPKASGSYAIFKDHLLNNVASGDENLFQWLFAWFAQIIQKPREKPGTAIVLRGSMGAGKSKVGEVFGSLIAANYHPVSDPRHITGNFNAFMAQCLLLQAEEAFWAGDKKAEGRLKDLITSHSTMIELKGVDPIKMPNYVRLLITSNEDWVVPAGKDERRFCVLDINPRCAKNFSYFSEMDEELNNGGREKLLYDLLNFDISNINLREIPKTKALLEQKIISLNHFDLWWLDRLKAGLPTKIYEKWPDYIPSEELFKDYLETCDTTRQSQKAHETIFGMSLKKLAPDIKKKRRTITHHNISGTKRMWVYELPSLEQCRKAFESFFGQNLDWD